MVISRDIVPLVPPVPAYDPMRGTTQSHIQGHLTARNFRCMFTIAGHVGTRRLYVVLLVTGHVGTRRLYIVLLVTGHVGTRRLYIVLLVTREIYVMCTVAHKLTQIQYSCHLRRY